MDRANLALARYLATSGRACTWSRTAAGPAGPRRHRHAGPRPFGSHLLGRCSRAPRRGCRAGWLPARASSNSGNARWIAAWIHYSRRLPQKLRPASRAAVGRRGRPLLERGRPETIRGRRRSSATAPGPPPMCGALRRRSVRIQVVYYGVDAAGWRQTGEARDAAADAGHAGNARSSSARSAIAAKVCVCSTPGGGVRGRRVGCEPGGRRRGPKPTRKHTSRRQVWPRGSVPAFPGGCRARARGVGR